MTNRCQNGAKMATKCALGAASLKQSLITCDPMGISYALLLATALDLLATRPATALPDTIAAKQVAGLVLAAGTVGADVSLDYTIGVPVATAPAPLPPAFTLDQNYPNPFNQATTVQYSLTQAAPVKIEVYYLLGRRVAVLAEGERAPGLHKVRVQAQAWASAVYLLRLSTPHGAATRRMVVAR